MNKDLINQASVLIDRLIEDNEIDAETPADWELLIRQARAAGLLERLAAFSIDKRLFCFPEYAAPHFYSAKVFFTSQQRILRWELHLLSDVFRRLQLPLVLLKGSAYAVSEVDASRGRIFNDIDILVPEDSLIEVKNALAWCGWVSEQLDRYDQAYYIRWMHELPPMRHIERNISLDIHHNILPKTCRYCPDADALLNNIVPVSGTSYWVLQPEDRVLHSASHLFLNGEFDRGLRDLSDIDLLLRQFNAEISGFYQRLVERGRQLGLSIPLLYALRYSQLILQTPVPEEAFNALGAAGGGFKKKVEDFLFVRALMPDHPSCNDRWTGLARFLLYIRSHWLKMPLYLLIPHLLRKSWMRMSGRAGH